MTYQYEEEMYLMDLCGFDEIVQEADNYEFLKILFNDVCEILEKNGAMLVGNNGGQPPLIGVSFAKHDRDILESAGLSKEQIDTFFEKGNKIHELEKQSDKGKSEISIAQIKIEKRKEKVIETLREMAERLLVFCGKN